MQDLFGHVDVAKEWQKDAEMTPASQHTSHTIRRRAIPQGSPDPDQEVEEGGQEDETDSNYTRDPRRKGLVHQW